MQVGQALFQLVDGCCQTKADKSRIASGARV
jgi:hypothetical protein